MYFDEFSGSELCHKVGMEGVSGLSQCNCKPEATHRQTDAAGLLPPSYHVSKQPFLHGQGWQPQWTPVSFSARPGTTCKKLDVFRPIHFLTSVACNTTNTYKYVYAINQPYTITECRMPRSALD